MNDRTHSAPPDHPQRLSLANEIHARPPEPLASPERASYIALAIDRDQREREHGHLALLCERFGAPPPPAGVSHWSARLGDLRLKWERHTEFTGYGFYVHGPGGFESPAVAHLPDGWLAAIPGRTIAAAHTLVIPDVGESSYAACLARWFPGGTVVGSEISNGAGVAFTDFRIGEDGYERFVLLDRRLLPTQAGRVSKRLFEIEAYRVMALLALPLAQEQAPKIGQIEQSLAALTEQIAHGRGGDEAMLVELSELAAKVENAIDAIQYRISASTAYYDLVRSRIVELQEGRIAGLQTIEEFMTRRLAPAMSTVASVAQRLRDLSERVARASGLLSTRVEIAREKQNQTLLESMERRARLQLRLQETVEGLSIAAITYYMAGLVGYLAKGAHAAGIAVDPEIAVAVSIPFIAGLVALGLARVRRHIGTAH
ncbi:MAG TPA: DUF3422 domain-containing protein [Casimicrobiaceae bacterium]|nr:DUF3422 domain-containing protein [Casimicrobiaceae bacterium]